MIEMARSLHPRPNRRIDPGCTSALQGDRAGFYRASSSIDIVDQHDVTPLHLFMVANRKCTANHLVPLGAAKAAQRLCRTLSEQQVGRPIPPKPSRQLRREQPRLIESTLPDPPAMQRHGDKQGSLTIHALAKSPRHGCCHGPRQRHSAPMFELERQRSTGLIIEGCGNQPTNPERFHLASRANLLLRPFQRDRTLLAHAIRQPINCGPAAGAKTSCRIHNLATARATRRQREIKNGPRDMLGQRHAPLSRHRCCYTSRRDMPPTLFDSSLRALRRDRAAMKGVETFLYDRAFEDIGERLASVQRDFRDILLVGCPNPQWAAWLRMRGQDGSLRIADPGALFAAAAGGRQEQEDEVDIEPQSVDLVIALGSLESANNIADALLRMRLALRPEGLLIGALAGGDSLAMLRSAMAAADQLRGASSAHVHPRIDPAGLTQLLTNAGLSMPVVDVDRVNVRYPSLGKLVDDLRAMGATNVLKARDRSYFGKAAYAAASAHARGLADQDGKFNERFDILHFTGWAPA